MEFTYVAYSKDRKLVKGKVSASNQQSAIAQLNHGGYQVVNLKGTPQLLKLANIKVFQSKVAANHILLFSRQLSLLIESGMDIVTSLEMLRGQVVNAALRDALGEIVADIREGKSLSAAMSRHPNVFPSMFSRAMAAGEQGGSLDVILKQMAEFMEKTVNTGKKLKAAMTYPIFVIVAALLVIAILTYFVFPRFIDLFTSLGADLPAVTKLLFGLVEFATKFGPIFIVLAVLAIIAAVAYTRTPHGKYVWDSVSLRIPIIGHIMLLNELSYCCRIMGLLIKAGLSMPEILKLAIFGSNNRFVAESLTGVQQELIRGEGLSRPMSRRKIFLPLMVQMIAIGEESGNLTNALNTVAESYETEADDRTRAAIGLIQPIITLGLGALVVFIAVALISAMFGIYSQLNL